MSAVQAIVNKPTRPALRYFGGKWRLAPWIIRHLPPHKRYIEPFGGSAGVLLNKPPAAYELYNDLNSDLAEFFQTLRDPDSSRRLLRSLRRTAYAHAELILACKRHPDAVERARRLAVRSMQSFHPRCVFDRKPAFDACASNSNPARTWMGYARALTKVAARLRSVVIDNRPALDVIRQHDQPGTLFYADPPYVSTTRSSGTKYRHDMTDVDHAALLDALTKTAGYVVLSGYDNDLYRDMLRGWTAKTMSVRVSNSKTKRTEILWLSPTTIDALERR